MLSRAIASRGRLSELFIGRDNSVGFLRLCMALAVVVSHSSPVGFGRPDPGTGRFGGQINLGRMSVYGFFIVSGFLITRSGARLGIFRYLWARLLRILPGLWGCVIVTAFVIAPLLYLHQNRGPLSGFWHAPGDGPWAYVQANGWTGFRQFDVSGILGHASKAHRVHDPGFDGALWSLAYEMTCYLIIGVLAVTGVLRAAPKFVMAIAIGLWIYIFDDLMQSPTWKAPQNLDGFNIYIPIVSRYIGNLSSPYLVYLGFAFALGAVFQLYAHRIPVSDTLGVLSAAVFVATLFWGGWFAFGVPAMCYLVFWLAVRLPRPFRAVGRKNDVSYGIYIYGFVVEQSLCVLDYNNRYGYVAFVFTAIAGTFVIATLSWFLVEKQFLRLKDWKPPLPKLPESTGRRKLLKTDVPAPRQDLPATVPAGAAGQ